MAKLKKEKHVHHSKKIKKKIVKGSELFHFSKEELTRENLVEAIIIRPAILILSFISFIGAMFLILIGNLKWGGSLILFSFILNLGLIYKSLTDEPSIYRTLNLIFKLVLFVSEIIAFNYVLLIIL